MPGTPDEKTIAEIKRLRLAGRALDAWALVSEMDPPEQWPARETRVQGARLLDMLGASGRAERVFWREWRRSKGASDLLQDVFWTVLERRGAYLTWKWLLRHAPGASAPADDLSDYEGCLAVVLTRLRDFDAAEAALQRGEALDPKERWFQVLRADLLQEQDCREAALDVARAAVEQDPDYATAVRTLAELLVELERVEEALEVLRAGAARLQSKGLAAQLAGLLIERGLMDEAEAALDLHERLAPLMDEELRDWHCGRRCDIASARGDHAEALRQAEQVRQGFYQLVAEKLRAAAPGLRRVLLPVPFVRQHHKTCAPASLTSIARFWGREVGHLDLAEEICHDGTPDHREREWAETHGWAAREFAVTVEAAERLIDAGMPFVMDTVHPGGAHAQVVTGYDQFRTVLFIRDPGNPQTTEFLAAEALAQQAPFGPRGFVMVPETESERLAAIGLPDTEPHDLLHQTRLSLAAHDRAGARHAVEQLRARHPQHRLRWQAELAVAEYDENHQATLEGLEELLRLFPEVENWQTRRLDLIRELRGREAYLEALRGVCAKPDSHPIHWRMLARELHWEAPGIPEARRWLRRVHRARLDSVAILTEANLLWETRDFANAAPIYRLAACLEEQNEGIWMTWFRAARWTRQPEAALDMLRRRFEQQGATSAAPAVTLYQALDQMNLSHEALAVLEESLRRRPDDADHALYVAGEMLLWNRAARAREILDSIRRGTRAAAWHRVRARLARQEGDIQAQMRHWRAVLEDQPLDNDARRALAWLMEQQEGAASALAWLRECCARHPFDWHAHVALLDWSRSEGFEAWESAVRELVRIDPRSAWARRELADLLRVREEYAAAHAALDHAATLEKNTPALHNIRASILEDEDRPDEARAECRRALVLDVDTTFAMRMLLRLCRSPEQRAEEMRFIQDEIRRQTTSGDALATFADLAQPYLTDEEMEAFLREAHANRPDLWHTGVQLACHWRNTDRAAEALDLLAGITERFPLMPRGWLETALCHEAAGDRAAAIRAGEKARELNPAWGWGMRTLSEFKRKAGDLPGARSVLEETLRQNPGDAITLGWLAEVLWQQGEKDAALERLSSAVNLDPGYNWAWDRLSEWGSANNHPRAAREAAARLLRERPAEARTWMIQARMLSEPGEFEEKLAALDKAIELSPDEPRPADLKALALAQAGRYDAALEVCRAHPSADVSLRLREGWILWERGSKDEAVRVMEAALVRDPAHIWGWERLADWHQERQELDKAEAACRQLIRLQPMEHVPLGYLGSLLEQRDKKQEAAAAYTRALEIFPYYPFAIARLLGLRFAAREWPEASGLLESLTPHHPALFLDSWRFALERRRGGHQQALVILECMLGDTHDDESCFQRVLDEVKAAPNTLRRAVRDSTARLLREGCPQVHAGAFYVGVCKICEAAPDLQLLEKLPPCTQAGRRAWNAWINLQGDTWVQNAAARARLRGLRQRRQWRAVMARHADAFRAESGLYGAVGYTLRSSSQNRALIKWFADWRERGPGMRPYMLNNLVLAFQEMGEESAAAEVVRAGMAYPEHGQLKMRFHLWAALEHALNENTAAALDCLQSVNPHVLDGYGQSLHGFVQTALEYQPGRRSPPFDHARKNQLGSLFDEHRNNRLIRASIRRCCRLASRRLGTSKPARWAFWKDNERFVGHAWLVFAILCFALALSIR